MRMRLLWGVVAVIALLCAVGGGWVAAGGSMSPPSIGPPFCGVGGSVTVGWKTVEGAPPYTVTVAGITVQTNAEEIEVACAELRARFFGGALLDHVTATVSVHVIDANGVEATSHRTMLLVADAPRDVPDDIELYVGYTDLHVYPQPWPFMRDWEEGGRPVASAVLVRYRKVGTTAWTYTMPFPPVPESSRYALASHASELLPGATYELQAAWVWYLGSPSARRYRSSPLRHSDALDWWEEEGADRWWRDWNDARALRWSEMLQFRPAGVEQLAVRARGDSIVACWRSALGIDYLVARSDELPGVIWVDPVQYSWSEEMRRSCGSSMIISAIVGLPADTRFEIDLLRVLPAGFSPAPLSSTVVRTDPPNGSGAARPADPRDIVVDAHANRVVVSWTPHEEVSTDLTLVPAGLTWQTHTSSLRQLPGGRSEMTFESLPSGSAQRLYVNRYPSSLVGPRPFVCAVWDIRLGSADPHAYLDRYLFSAAQEDEASVRPGRIPPLAVGDYPRAPYCRLFEVFGE